MKTTLRVLTRSVALVAALAIAAPTPLLAQSPAAAAPDPLLERNLTGFLDQLLQADDRADPLSASVRGERRYDHLWSDASPAGRAERVRVWRRLLREAERMLDRAALAPGARIDLELARHVLSLRLDEARHHPEQMPLTQQTGPFVSYPQLPQRLTFTERAHYVAYIERLRALPAHLEDLEANMRAGIEAGRTPPRVALQSVPTQAEAVAADRFIASPHEHPMFAPFRDPASPPDLRLTAMREMTERVIPAWRRFAAFVESEYIPTARETIAATELPGGEAYYETQIRRYTTLELDAEEIHRVGRREVARIRAEMFSVINETGFADGRAELPPDELFDAFVTHLRTDPRFYHETPEDLLRHYRDICKRADAELPKLFTRLPRLSYGVRALPDFLAPAAPTAYYYPGSIENGVPGYFMANTHNLSQRPTYEAVALALHEAVPGHHFQVALAQELEEAGLHEWRTTLYFTGFGEGWGLYAERLGLEMATDEHPRGLYADPYDAFGRLSYDMWRAMRLVVDTGIHAKGWSRQRAIDYMLANSALAEANVASEVDRYIAWPGQALGYKLGELFIRDLRQRAETELKDAFDLRLFHDHLLAQGSTTLPILERRVEEWIDSRRELVYDPDDDM